MKLPIDPDSVKGFLAPDEGAALHRAALLRAKHGPCVEIGGYCGKSALYIGTACAAQDEILFSIDHHRGSEENQPGWEYFECRPFGMMRRGRSIRCHFSGTTMRRAGLEGNVIPIVGRSIDIAERWQTPISMLFIDGGHTIEHALHDYRSWTPHLRAGSLLAIHDVFPDPADGGRPPFEIYQMALSSGLYEEIEAVASLRLLQRL